MMFRPGVDFFCDVDYDPFLFMEENKKVYGTLLVQIPSHTPRRPLTPHLNTLSTSCPSLHFHLLTHKISGFTITIHEYEATIPTLWATTKEFMKEHPEYIAKDNGMAFLSDNNGDSYNLCHCESNRAELWEVANTDCWFVLTVWSNLEIADMDFWRSDAYMAYFNYLESKGGFYYEVRLPSSPPHPRLHFFLLTI